MTMSPVLRVWHWASLRGASDTGVGFTGGAEGKDDWFRGEISPFCSELIALMLLLLKWHSQEQHWFGCCELPSDDTGLGDACWVATANISSNRSILCNRSKLPLLKTWSTKAIDCVNEGGEEPPEPTELKDGNSSSSSTSLTSSSSFSGESSLEKGKD